MYDFDTGWTAQLQSFPFHWTNRSTEAVCTTCAMTGSSESLDTGFLRNPIHTYMLRDRTTTHNVCFIFTSFYLAKKSLLCCTTAWQFLCCCSSSLGIKRVNDSTKRNKYFISLWHFHCFSTYPEVSVLEVTAIVFDYPWTVALLHNGDLLDDLLEVSIHRHLFDGQYLPRLLMQCLVNTAIGPATKQNLY